MPNRLAPLDLLFEDHFGAPPTSREPVAAQGSRRRMVRLKRSAEEVAIGVLGPDAKENAAFVAYARALRGVELPVPEVLGVDEGRGAYLVEDLGDSTLFETLREARAESGDAFPASVQGLYDRTLATLARLQVEGGRVVDYSVAYPRAAFDVQSMRWDMHLFKYLFLRLGEVPFEEGALEDDFETFAAFLAQADADHFLYRDFQSRNIMVRGDAPWFIDFQGGRKGALQYDVASLLYEGGTALSESVREDLLARYLVHLRDVHEVDEAAFRRYYRGFVLIRTMQALGAYGLLGLHRRQDHFLRSIPRRQNDLRHLLDSGFVDVEVPELRRVLERVAKARIPGVPLAAAPSEELRVRLISFSYKRGLPVDPGGHGGGYVFDCRAVPNPGRQEAMRARTGLDKPVRDLLAGEAGAKEFFDGARRLAELQVREYLRRGFDSLHIAFGCTGGQHRSVYFTERLARHLATLFAEVRVDVEHRERLHWPSKR